MSSRASSTSQAFRGLWTGSQQEHQSSPASSNASSATKISLESERAASLPCLPKSQKAQPTLTNQGVPRHRCSCLCESVQVMLPPKLSLSQLSCQFPEARLNKHIGRSRNHLKGCLAKLIWLNHRNIVHKSQDDLSDWVTRNSTQKGHLRWVPCSGQTGATRVTPLNPESSSRTNSN